MCNWTSKNKQFRCDRNSLNGFDYCLFHKPDKTKDETVLFWRIVNFKNSSPQLINLHSELYKGGNYNYPISHLMEQEIERIHDSNFTSEEKAKSDYKQLKDRIVNAYYESRISGKGNMVRADFRGFIFPKTDTFEYQFKYDYNPWSDGTLLFNECIFEGFINFSSFNFLGQTDFEDCDFKGSVIFTNSTFNKNVNFINTSINTGFGILGMGMFQDTRFLGKRVLFDNVTGLLEFDSFFSDKTDFELKNRHFPIDFGIASYGENAFRIARIQKEKNGDFAGAADYFYLEKCYKGYQILPEPYFWDKNQVGFKKFQFLVYLKTDKAYKKILPKFIDWFFKFSIGYGEKPNRALRMLLIIMFVFAFFYMFIDIEVGNRIINYDLYFGLQLFSIEHWKVVLNDFGNCLYFSIVTLSTVGYGDITPVSGLSKILSAFEMFLGVTFVGAWTATLLRKMIK